jgi:hypothetical protein
MAEYHLPNKARQILRALIDVVKPKKPGFDPPIEDHMVNFLDNFYSYFPWHLKLGFPMGLYLLEYGTLIFHGSIRPFSKLSIPEREAYVKGWINSSMMLRRDLIKGVKGVCLTAFYSHPEVMAHIGYDLAAHLERVHRGEPADPAACAYFRGRGYDRNTKIPYPAYDRVDLIAHDTPPAGE